MPASRTRRGGNAPKPAEPAVLADVPDGVQPELSALRTVMDRLLKEPRDTPGTDSKTSVENLTRLVTVSLKAIELAWTHREPSVPDLAQLLDGIIDAHAPTLSAPIAAVPALSERTSSC